MVSATYKGVPSILPWWEFVLRGGIIYVLVLELELLRLTGKRQIGQLAPFDLVLVLRLQTRCRTP